MSRANVDNLYLTVLRVRKPWQRETRDTENNQFLCGVSDKLYLSYKKDPMLTEVGIVKSLNSKRFDFPLWRLQTASIVEHEETEDM